MKRILTTIIGVILILAFTTNVYAARQLKSASIINLVGKYRNTNGFEIVTVGSLGLGLTRLLAKLSTDDPEDKAKIEMIEGIEKLVVVEYEDADIEARNEFNAKVASLLSKAEKILEVKDDGETVNIYGTSSGNGAAINDLIIFVPEDYALVCLFGSISADKLGALVTTAND